VPLEIRRLIREVSIANPLWGAPRVHGELLKLGINIGQTSVAKYMVRRRHPPSQGWKTFIRNHADGIAAMDLFVVPTISFRLLYGLLIMGHGRRQILWFGVTSHPTAEWIANQITEACGWEQAPRYLIRDRDRAYGEVFIQRLRSIVAQFSAVVGLVAEHAFRWLHSADEALRDRAIVCVASSQQNGDEAPFSICECVNLRVAPVHCGIDANIPVLLCHDLCSNPTGR
jgi:hypothetical protein